MKRRTATSLLFLFGFFIWGTSNHVIPAKLVPAGSRQGAGIQNLSKILDSRLRGNDNRVSPLLRTPPISVLSPQEHLLWGIPIRAKRLHTSEDWQIFSGVGPVLGKKIAEQQRRAPFTKEQDLLEVSGLGPKKVAKIGPFLSFF